jgi:hypothetical protein
MPVRSRIASVNSRHVNRAGVKCRREARNEKKAPLALSGAESALVEETMGSTSVFHSSLVSLICIVGQLDVLKMELLYHV